MSDISDDDVDPSPTNPLDAVDPGFRYEPKMVRQQGHNAAWEVPLPEKSIFRCSIWIPTPVRSIP